MRRIATKDELLSDRHKFVDLIVIKDHEKEVTGTSGRVALDCRLELARALITNICINPK